MDRRSTSMIFPALCAAVVLACTAYANDVQKPMREASKFETVWQNDDPVRIISGQTVEFKLPAVPARAGVQTVISLRTRLQTDRLNGWNTYLAVWVNGRPVNAVDDLIHVRLLNRPNPYNDKVYKLGYAIQENRLNTFFSPSFDKWTFQLAEPVQAREKYWFILRVEDLLHTDRPNTLTLSNMAKYLDFGAKKAEDIVVVVNPLEVGYLQRVVARSNRKLNLAAKSFKPLQTVRGENSVLEINKFGGLRLSHRGKSFVLESSFSYPKAGLNLFSGALKECQKSWKPTVSVNGSKVTISARGTQHAVKRVINVRDDRLDFSDTIENTTDKILPVMAMNSVGLASPHEAFWIGGRPNGGSIELAAAGDPCNSTLFINSNDIQIGIYAKDTVLRNQFWIENSPGLITCGTNQLGIAPKSSYTLRWRMYLTDDPDYFTFINRIRRDDNLNFTLIGPMEMLRYTEYWGSVKPEVIQKAFATQCWRIGSGDPWLEYHNGPMRPMSYDRDKYKEMSRSSVENILDVVPGFFVLAGREMSFFTVAKDADWSKHPRADSFEKGPDGVYVTIPERCPDPASVYMSAYSALDNSYHKQLMADVDYLMDECGYPGLYFDIFTRPGAVSYDRWDGHSVEIDPKTYALVRTKNNVPILLGPAQAAMVQKAFDKGGIVVCNQSCTSEEMQSLPVMSFVEGVINMPSTHLYSPIGLSNMWTNFTEANQKKASTLVDQITQRLKLGGLTYYYASFLGLGPSEYEAYGILTHSFPLTPVGLHAGWIEGKERTITCKAGTFTWKRPDKPMVLIWNSGGRRVNPTVPMTKVDRGWTVNLGNLPAGGVAIIEENPYE